MMSPWLIATLTLATYALDCFKCINGQYDHECLTEPETCQGDQICMTEFRQENGQVRITKGCKQRNACDVQARTNRTLCYEYPYVRVCHSCCEGDFCNDDMELPPFRKESAQCGKPAVKPLLTEFGSVRSKFRKTFGGRRFRRSVQSNMLSWSPKSTWGYSTSDIGVGIDLLQGARLEDAEPVETYNNTETGRIAYEFDDAANITQLLDAGLIDMPDINMKIAKARPAVPGSWAWVAQIKYFRNGRYEFVCAGTLVADQWILTAAQCLSDEESGQYDVKNMIVALGVFTLRGGDEKDRRQIFEVMDYQIHPNFRTETTTRNDIALLRLNGFAKETEFVHPACLPFGRYTNEYTDYEADANMVAEADYCWFVGWGFTGARPSSQQVKPNDLARVLQQSRHYLMQHDTCNQILDEWNIDKKEHLCAVGYEKSPYIGHACEGDGGGPLVCRHKDKSWFIAGVEIGQSSYCGAAPFQRVPSIFSRVSVFENWINKVIYTKETQKAPVKSNNANILAYSSQA